MVVRTCCRVGGKEGGGPTGGGRRRAERGGPGEVGQRLTLLGRAGAGLLPGQPLKGALQAR